MTLCRLAKEQGLLTGDLNEVQQLALLVILREDTKATDDREWRDFRSMLFAMHPSEAKTILDALDEAREAEALKAETGLTQFADPLDDNFRKKDYVPFSAEEVEGTIALLREFGIELE